MSGPYAYQAWAERREGYTPDKPGFANVLCKLHADKNPSMSINLKTGYMHCFGCDWHGWPDQYCEQTGESYVGLPEKSQPRKPRERKPLPAAEAEYVYTTGEGRNVLKVVRYPGKEFRQFRWEHGTWKPGAKDSTGKPIPRVPYNLPAIHKQEGAPVLWCEGEKDCDNATRLGLLATTSPQGVRSFHLVDPQTLAVFAGRTVTIIPDNDPEGASYARTVGAALRKAGADVRVLNLPNVPPKGDLSDWLQRGGTKEQLEQLIAGAPRQDPTEDPGTADEPDDVRQPSDFPRTELGNAELVHHLFGRDLRLCHNASAWYVFTGSHWKRDDEGTIQHLVNQAARERLKASASIDDKDRRDAEAKWALRSESNGVRNGTISQLRSLPGITIGYADLDREPMMLNCQNGTVDLETGRLHPHRREAFCSQLAPVNYDPDAACPVWERFLHRVLGGSEQLIRFIQRSIGYSLTGSTREEVLFLLWGVGQNGKTKLLETLLALLGSYAVAASPETFMARRHDPGIRNDLARLRSARFVKAVETENGKRLAEGLIKQATGGDKITARFLYENEFSYSPQFKLWLATNHKPEIRGTDNGIWRRLRLIPFQVTIPEAERDKHLQEKLLAELPGILAWAVRGCLDWQKLGGLQEPAEVTEATNAYRQEQDTLANFLEAHCIVETGRKVLAGELFARYDAWARASNEFPYTRKRFSQALVERGFSRGFLGATRSRTYEGLDLLPLDEADHDRDRSQGDRERSDAHGSSDHVENARQEAIPGPCTLQHDRDDRDFPILSSPNFSHEDFPEKRDQIRSCDQKSMIEGAL